MKEHLELALAELINWIEVRDSFDQSFDTYNLDV